MLLAEHLHNNNISFKQHNGYIHSYIVEDFGALIQIFPKEDKIFEDNFSLILDEAEMQIISENEDIEYFAFEFGGKFYYSKIGEEEIKLTPLLYVGKHTGTNDFTYLGIHTGFEITNAIGLPENYIRKAKFLGIKSLGISQTETLNGVIDFQLECEKHNIKSILGITIHVHTYEVILYAKNKEGWKNILNIHSQFSVFGKKSITHEYLFEKSEGVICILSNWYEMHALNEYGNCFGDDLYYKIDTVEWQNNERDKRHLLQFDMMLRQEIAKPVLICECFYLEPYQHEIRKFANSINKINSYDSHNQYFKSYEQICKEFKPLFKEEETFWYVFDFALQSAEEINQKCDFKIETGQRYLPRYEMTEEESKQYSDNEELFWALIEQGLADKIISKNKNIDIYIERVNTEYDVLSRGGLIDYFLILYDFCRWMRENNIQYGYGRGSAAGCLITYLLGGVKLDPIEFDLLFERFLNEARLMSSLPDIDTDIEGDARDRVKDYLRGRYGKYNVAEVGTYQNLKIKSGLTDILKHFNVEHHVVKFLTSLVRKDTENGEVTDLFKLAQKETKLLKYIQQYPDAIEYLENLMWHPRSRGVHASATIIVPKEDERQNFFDWAPTEKIDEHIVTQWDGLQMELIGYLKEDLLGLAQLDKFHDIRDLISDIQKITPISIDDIPLDDEVVLEYFSLGLNEDVFQFGSLSQKQYTQKLKPDNIEELIAANALYRPGPMDTGAHQKFINIKFGEEEPDYPPFLEDILKKTFGLFVYQEQVMAAYQKLTKCSMPEADSFRKFVSKIKGDNQSDEKYLKYEKTFTTGYQENFGVSEDIAQDIWHRIVGFAQYGFNRSHAAAYAITGYIAQWFKVHYPLEFWVTALNRATQDTISVRINEINKLNVVKVLPPDINYSNTKFAYNANKMHIYWAISSIKQAGEKSVEKFLEERSKKQFISFDDFYKRCKEAKLVNKAVVINLILCGCFDQIENIQQPKDRKKIIDKYCKLSGEVLDRFNDKNFQFNYSWDLLTKELCEYDNINYKAVVSKSIFANSALEFFDFDTIVSYEESTKENHVISAGVIRDIKIRFTKSGEKIITCTLDQNNNFIKFVVWKSEYETFKDLITDANIGKIIVFSGRCSWSKYDNMNCMYTSNRSKSKGQIIS